MGALGLADCLAGLTNRLVGDRAAVDDDEVVLARGERPHRLALGGIEAAAEGDDFDAHKSISPVKTWAAVPLMRTLSPGAHSMTRVPPGRFTATGEVIFPYLMAATAVAQAPVPQAWVSPAPRSHTRRS